ncbi:MAG: hypothetical protein HZC40_01120 [Chloroflexi bacterium]|nr:hypothetical protein [Chloroflexota bacterium]
MKGLRFYLAGLPALLVTGIALFLLLAAVSNVAASQPGDLLYSLRAPALQLQLSLTNDPAKRAELERELAPTLQNQPDALLAPPLQPANQDALKPEPAKPAVSVNDDKPPSNAMPNSSAPEDKPKDQSDDDAVNKKQNKPGAPSSKSPEDDDKSSDDKSSDDKSSDDKSSSDKSGSGKNGSSSDDSDDDDADEDDD